MSLNRSRCLTRYIERPKTRLHLTACLHRTRGKRACICGGVQTRLLAIRITGTRIERRSPLSWFELNFAELPDPRTGNATQHNLMEVLTIALTASIAGAQNCTEFAAFGVDRKDLFDEFLDLNNGIPSHPA
ncbi:hypothetical protein CKO28_27140 [Rhodovibrio sodomensis]|uniref:H repeat-associated protein N-terminal domain-containing protein n=1 Tax=Rhodovibrio sodomensis TaxID=1088 RepID=A0ABS1DNI4_9PROT|nr:hypothetical protein [Rhodovibrio sodomensis]